MEDRRNEDDALQLAHAVAPGRQIPELGPNSAIGRKLKAYYDDVAREPVPDRFLSLLDALDAAEASTSRVGRE